MLYSFHEELKHRESANNESAFGLLGQNHSWGMGGPEDCRPSAGNRRAAAELDCRRTRFDPHEPESMGPGHKRERGRDSSREAAARTARPADGQALRAVGEAIRRIPSKVWIKPSPMGWSHVGDSFAAAVWDKAESAPGPELDASIGVPAEARRPCLSASEGRRSSEVSKGIKKNSKGKGDRKRGRGKGDRFIF